MGICLDTDASAAQDTNETANEAWKRTNPRNTNSASGSAINVPLADMDNAGKIKFDPPKVPVIFVLGGPGSGKVTHCDTFMQERRGVIHINMMDLLQQYAMGNDMQDFAQLSSKTVTEVLMLEMKMAPAAKAYLISGYPRSMRDVVEYSEKIQIVNGVILISWRQSVLQKQIDYGAKLGHVVLSLAKMELENFFKNVMPVADYFDQSDMLLAVNGERAPTEVYKDFRTAILDILSALENQEAILNGVTEPAVRQQRSSAAFTTTTSRIQDVEVDYHQFSGGNAAAAANGNGVGIRGRVVASPQGVDAVALMGQNISNAIAAVNHVGESVPPVIWVIGGPGSNKASLCLKAVGLNPGWGHISIGRILRTITDSAPRANTESYAIKEALTAGEMVPEKNLNALLDVNIRQLMDKKGIIIDGFPRNLQQVSYFETKYKVQPPVVLLDCSKLQLGRGRVDDTVSSFRRRLELFREQTLPMLKSMDNSSRLIIVDGDTDSPSVQREFEKIIRNHIQKLTVNPNQNPNNMMMNDLNNRPHTTTMRNVTEQTDAILNDLENNVPGAVPTISHHVSMMNGHLKSNSNNVNSNNVNNMNHHAMVGGVKTGMNGNAGKPMDFRHMLEEAERHPVDSYM
ncbi:adenylate kinase isoenzyme 5 isoform X2 [Episyrphus balteatus]|uniref:adenylate kinase isoenzyme 5 isoform X2 n=1 Tax=Episyrphus balteatus TaxID=286459 RepID=UPI002485768F|nr:adenylate kinase isoenzyme 5 isoform X2 [Episyrphus balteatus]